MKRSVGMALIDSNIRFDPTKEIIFQVGDKDKIIAGLDARLTDTNLLGGFLTQDPHSVLLQSREGFLFILEQ